MAPLSVLFVLAGEADKGSTIKESAEEEKQRRNEAEAAKKEVNHL